MARRSIVLLLVSADRRFLEIQQRAATATGYHILLASTVRRARALLGAIHPAAILADAELPDGRGLEILTLTRRKRALRMIPILLCGKLTEDERWHVLADPWAMATVSNADAVVALDRMYTVLAAPHAPQPPLLWFASAVLRQWWKQRRTGPVREVPRSAAVAALAYTQHERGTTAGRQAGA